MLAIDMKQCATLVGTEVGVIRLSSQSCIGLRLVVIGRLPMDAAGESFALNWGVPVRLMEFISG